MLKCSRCQFPIFLKLEPVFVDISVNHHSESAAHSLSYPFTHSGKDRSQISLFLLLPLIFFFLNLTQPINRNQQKVKFSGSVLTVQSQY